MSDPVAMELRRWAAEPFVWGETDCGLSMLAYAERITGKHYEGGPRHRYACPRSAGQFLRAEGGYAAYSRRVLGALGWELTDTPERGDIGLVRIGRMASLTACLCLGKSWAARGNYEIVIAPARPTLIWRAPCLKQ